MAVERSKRVILVEEEELVRCLMVRILTRWGFDVQEFATPHSALEYVRSAPPGGVAEVLITDVAVPGMTGPEMGRAILSEWPHVKILYVTGVADSDMDDCLAADPNPILRKPFTSKELVGEVRNLLEAGARGGIGTVQAMDEG